MEGISEEDSSHRPAAAGSHLADLRREEGRAHAHEGPAATLLKKIEEAPWEEANNGREIDAYWLREKLKGFLPRPANPEEAAALRRSREWREGKAPLLKGYTEDHLREAWWRYLERKTPTETAKAAGAANGGRGMPRQTSRLRPRMRRALRRMARMKTGPRPAPAGNGAHNGHGPAKRRTRPSEAQARRGGMIHMDQVSPNRSALAHFKVRPSYATDAATATALVAEIITDAGEGLIAVDLETTPLPSERARLADLTRRVAEAKGKVQACAERRDAARRGADGAAAAAAALAIAKAELAALQSAVDHAGRAGLDPHRSTARLCQLYGGGARVAVIDLHKVDWAVLAPVWERPIVMHNAAFDLGYLAQRGIEPVGVDCTMQAVRLLNGPNATSLETAAASYFGLALDKALQTSDWGAKHLSLAQVTYAADDAVVTWQLAETVLPLLGERRTAYDIQVGAIPAVVRMQLRGILLDATAHAALIAALKAERARLAGVYAAACEEAGRPDLRRAGVPDNAPAIEALLAGLLDGAGAAGLAADAEEREAQHQAGRPRRGRGRLSAAQGAGRHRPDREAAQHLWRAPGGADLADDRPHPRLLQDRRRDLRPQHLQQAEHAEHSRRAAGRGVAELPDAVRGAAGLCLRCGRLVLDGDAGGRAHRGGRGHDAGLRARRGPARAHREDHARARRRPVGWACPRTSASGIASMPSR